jgi:hypothetical protein
MVGGKVWAWLVAGITLAVTALIVVAFSGKAAPKEKKTSAMLAGAAPAVQAPLATKPVARPAPRESTLSTYTNAEYGVSFTYPRNYPLDEGPLDEETVENIEGLRSQEQLESEQPGGVLEATIIIPDDSFPNTTFAGGSVQFAVNRYMAGEGCRKLPATRLGDAGGASGTSTIQGVVFAWADSEAGEGDTEFFERDYAGFANGTCYEFFVRVGTVAGDDSARAKPVNQKKIVAQLEKIVGSWRWQAKESSMLDEKGPTKAHGGKR